MNSARHFAVVGSLALILGGCRHTSSTAPPQAQAPTIKTAPATPPPSGNPLTSQSQLPLPSLPPATEDASKHAPPPPAKPHRVHHKPKPGDGDTPASGTATSPAPATAAATPPATAPPTATPALTPRSVPPPPVQTADTSGPSTPSSIGLLSTGDATTTTQTRHDTETLIVSTGNGLSNLKRALSTQEQQVAADIRTFLQKAKAALDTDDLDGAHTLATKAKVLLDELTKQ